LAARRNGHLARLAYPRVLFAFRVSWMTQGRLSATALMDPVDERDRKVAYMSEELAEIVEDAG